MKQSKFLNINIADIKKALIVGAGTLAAGEMVTPTIDTISELPPQATHTNSIVYAIVATVIYLLKNWLTNSKGEVIKSEDKPEL